MPNRIFAERAFTIDGREVRCRFYQPVLDETDYRCDIEVDWPEPGTLKHVWGVDGVQALLLAMQRIHVELLAAREKRGMVVSWLRSPDLDLPLPNDPRE